MKPYQTDEHRIPKREDSPIEDGLFAPEEPVDEQASVSIKVEDVEALPQSNVSCEVVDCNADNELTASPKPTQQPTAEAEESIDLNDINPDPYALPPFPLWVLPAPLKDLISIGKQVYGVPVEFFAMPALQAIGSMLRKTVYTQGKFRNHPQLWAVLVAQSGIGKSYPMNMALQPLIDIDSLSHNDYLEKHSAWEKEQARKNKGKDKWTPEPIFNQIIIEDTTPEALFKALSHNPKGLLLYRDEIIGWFKDIGRYNKSGELQHYLSLFDGKSLTVNRKTQMILRLENPFLSVLGSVQPNVLTKWLQDPAISDNGFIQRFLFVFPDNIKKSMPNNEVIPDAIINNYDSLINKIGELSLGQNGTGKEIHFTDDARRLLYDYECILTNRHNNTECDYLQAMYDKMLIHVNRLVIIIAVARYCAGEVDFEIDADTMRYCIELGEYFIATGEKVYHLISAQSSQLVISNSELMKLLFKRYNIKNQSELAKALNISQQGVNKLLN